MNIAVVGLTDATSIRGVERYTLEFCKAIANHNQAISITLICGPWQEYFLPLKDLGIKIKHPRFVSKGILSRHLYTFFVAPLLCLEYDIVHVANTYPILLRRKNLVVTIHDLAEYFVKDKYSFSRKIYRRFTSVLACRAAAKIITVSNYSANTIHEKLKVPREKIKVIYLGADHFTPINHEFATQNNNSSNKEILYWGAIENSKGLKNLILAIDLLYPQFPDIKLNVVGKQGNAFNEFISMIETRPWISYLGYIPDSTLFSLIRNSRVVAFPSLFEGFGLPAIEAFVYNDNVVTSNTTSLGEITKDFALQVNPEDPRNIAGGIAQLLISPLKFSSSEKSNILSNFNWESSAEKLIDTYKEILIFSKVKSLP